MNPESPWTFPATALAALVLACNCMAQDELTSEERKEQAKAIAKWDADALRDARMRDLESSGLARAESRFGMELLRQLVASDPAANHLVAPLGAFMMLNLAAEGASAGLRDRLAAVLHVQHLDRPSVRRAIGTLRQRLGGRDEATIDVACAVWLAGDLEPSPEFVAAASDGYGATVRQLDFADPKSVEVVNGWAAANTHGMVPAVVNELAGWPMLGLTVTGFKASWVHHFEQDETRPHAFTDAMGRVSQVPMMHVEQEFAYEHDTTLGAQLVRLPLVALPSDEEQVTLESTCSLYVILPDAGSTVSSVLDRLVDEPLSWRFTFRQFAQAIEITGEVWLPRFRIRSELALADVLSRMGLNKEPAGEGFNGIVAGTDFPWFEMRESNTVNVDEWGVAATSADAFIPLSFSRGKAFSFVADHPFVCLLFDEVTGTLLFAGVMSRPN